VKLRWLKWTGLASAGLLVLAVVTVLGAGACIRNKADGYVFESLDQLPSRTSAIVLGARINRDGRPSQALLDRIDCGYELFAAGRVQTIFVSGDGEQDAVMARALIERGVPAAKVIRDPAGHRTRATMMNARASGIRDAIVCTQGYHQPRSVAWARHFDIDAVGWSADRRPYSTRPKDDVREAFARTLAMLEMWAD
jgi:SanA protein